MKPHPWLAQLRTAAGASLAVVLVSARLGVAAPPEPSEGSIRQKLTEILAREEFSPNGRQKWMEGLLRDFFGWLAGLHETNVVLFWLLLGGCLALLLVLVGHVGWTVSRAFSAGAKGPGTGSTEEERGRLSLSYWEEARRRAGQHEFTEAVRFLFLSLVYRFDESGRVGFQQAATNREYLALFAERPRVQAELKVFVDTLDDHWYGQHPTEERQYESCLALYEHLQGQRD
jgi:hypothetical protein